MRSAMRAASQLPGKGPTDVDDAPAPARQFMVMAETSTFSIFCGRNICCRNVQAETSVAEMSVAEMSEHRRGYDCIRGTPEDTVTSF